MMTFTSEQLATLRKIAQQATQGEWRAFISPDTGTYAVHTPGDERCGDIIKWPGFDGQKNAENNAEFIAAFNPKLVQTLLDERERNLQYIKSRDQENEDIALTVGKLRVELETAKKRIAELEAEPVSQTCKLNKLSGNSPVTPDGWISCSDRMPDNDESKPIAIFTGKCLGQGMFVATYDDDGFFDYWEGMEIIGVTHWMPLPEPPQEVNRG
ncbi:DUF551 domain-containing protein [Salmonella enterica subsp. enterica serovar Hadar]|nr:DUF551 domain-containing protein [Salmonella enterica subsp. enterica serovar Hadar]